MEEENATKKFNIWKIIGGLALACEVAAAVILACNIFASNLLGERYLIPVIVAMVAFAIIGAVLILRPNAGAFGRSVGILGAVVLCAGYLYGAQYIASTISFIQSATGEEIETQRYSVIVLKSESFNALKDLQDRKIAMRDEEHLDNARQVLSQDLSFEAQKFEDLGTMVLALDDKKVSAIALADSYVQILNENQEGFAERTKEIFSFEIKFPKQPKQAVATDLTKEPFAIYISGSDSRVKLSDRDRSDVNIVAVVNPQEHKILLVSTPRDYYVQLHGTTGTKDKLTHAGIYGIDMSRQTLEDLLGIEIQHSAKVGFETVVRLVDLLGGIEIDSDTAFTVNDGTEINGPSKECKFVKGKQHVDGKCALRFARERYVYTSGDRHRGQNQQQVLTKVIDKAMRLENLSRYPEIMKAMEGLFITSMTYDEMTGFAKAQLDSLKPWTVESISLDGTGDMQPTYSMGAQRLYVMNPDPASVAAAQAKIAEYMGTNVDEDKNE